MRLMHMMTSAALFALTASALPSTAFSGDVLSGVGGAPGSAGGGIASATADVNVGGGGSVATVSGSANVGGLNANVGANVGSTTSATANIGTTTGNVISTKAVDVKADVSLGKPAKPLGGTAAKASVAGKIEARAKLLSPRSLLKLCITVGAKGCDGASRDRQIALIKARIGKLSGRQLASACVSVGGSGCGASLTDPGGGGTGGGGTGGGGGSTPVNTGGGGSTPGTGTDGGKAGVAVSLASASGSDKEREMRITCRSVLGQPGRYETGLVKLCRKMLQ